jgi:hypothetical protein
VERKVERKGNSGLNKGMVNVGMEKREWKSKAKERVGRWNGKAQDRVEPSE